MLALYSDDPSSNPAVVKFFKLVEKNENKKSKCWPSLKVSIMELCTDFFQLGHSRPLFLHFRNILQTVNSKYAQIKGADDWIRTRDLWNRKHPRYQLCHNTARFVLKFILN